MVWKLLKEITAFLVGRCFTFFDSIWKKNHVKVSLLIITDFLSENCLDYLYRNKRDSGEYEIRPSKDQSSFRVYCDQDTGTGSWLNIGKRDGGALSFYDKSFKVCVLLYPRLLDDYISILLQNSRSLNNFKLLICKLIRSFL